VQEVFNEANQYTTSSSGGAASNCREDWGVIRRSRSYGNIVYNT
jgi:hypothetical protein